MVTPKKKKLIRIPSHVREAVNTLQDYTKCNVEAKKEEDIWVLFLFSHEPKLISRWKGLEVRRAW